MYQSFNGYDDILKTGFSFNFTHRWNDVKCPAHHIAWKPWYWPHLVFSVPSIVRGKSFQVYPAPPLYSSRLGQSIQILFSGIRVLILESGFFSRYPVVLHRFPALILASGFSAVSGFLLWHPDSPPGIRGFFFRYPDSSPGVRVLLPVSVVFFQYPSSYSGIRILLLVSWGSSSGIWGAFFRFPVSGFSF